MNKKLDILSLCPKTKELIEKSKNKPTITARVEALENAVSELAVQTMGVNENA